MTESDLDLAIELARRSAASLDNARLFQQTEFQRAVLERQGEASIDGLLVVGADASILSINERFREIWQLPDEAIAQGDDAALEAAMERVDDPDAFIARVREVYAHREVTREELRFRDGRTIQRLRLTGHGRRRLVPGLPVVSSGTSVTRSRSSGRSRPGRGRRRRSSSSATASSWSTRTGSSGSGTPPRSAITGLAEADVLGEPAAEARSLGWPLDRRRASAPAHVPVRDRRARAVAVALGRRASRTARSSPSAT